LPLAFPPCPMEGDVDSQREDQGDGWLGRGGFEKAGRFDRDVLGQDRQRSIRARGCWCHQRGGPCGGGRSRVMSDPRGPPLWDRPPAPDWSSLRMDVLTALGQVAAHLHLDDHVAEDALQEALLRFLGLPDEGALIVSLRAWLLTTATHLLQDVRRGRRGPLGWPAHGPCLREASGLDGLSSTGPAPLQRLVLKECWERAPRLFRLLPAPYRQVAMLQFLRGWSRGKILGWLQIWRPVSEATCRGILRRTHQMLPLLGAGGTPRARWPGRYDPGKNPWIVTPPPISASIG